MPRSLNHESEQEPREWMYTPSSMGYEGETELREPALLERDKNTLHAKQKPPKLTRSCGCIFDQETL